jgi:metallophosphoesterase superfamily enzyme
VILVRGNHDRDEESKMKDHGIDSVYSFVNEEPFFFTHEKKNSSDKKLYNISGHIHPAVTLSGIARQSKSFPCFWFSEKFAVLPAFGNFTGKAIVHPLRSDRIFIVFNEQVKEINSANEK